MQTPQPTEILAGVFGNVGRVHVRLHACVHRVRAHHMRTHHASDGPLSTTEEALGALLRNNLVCAWRYRVHHGGRSRSDTRCK